VIEINKIPNYECVPISLETTWPFNFELFDPNLLPYFEFAHRRTLYCIQGSSCFSYFSYILVNSYKHLKTESLNAYLPSRRVTILTVNFIITSVNPMTIMNWLNGSWSTPPALKSKTKYAPAKINNIAVTKLKIDSLQTQPK
jgi:hypothetical protein